MSVIKFSKGSPAPLISTRNRFPRLDLTGPLGLGLVIAMELSGSCQIYLMQHAGRLFLCAKTIAHKKNQLKSGKLVLVLDGYSTGASDISKKVALRGLRVMLGARKKLR